MKKKVFIIGNGFDLDLGWKTRYKDFVDSDYWPLKENNPNCDMARYLVESTNVDRWFDLEAILKSYALDTPFNQFDADPKDEAFFTDLKQSLIAYLKTEEVKTIDERSLAIQVLKAVIDNGYFTSIYTFNFTDLYKIAEKANLHSNFDYESVHGTLGNSSIILGVDDQCKLRNGFAFLRKVFSEHYRPHHIHYDLQECDEVVFFGHSLGDIDYPYFKDFFEKQSHCYNSNDCKYITIFTKDNNSRIQILEQLRSMNEGQTERLLNDNKFKIIMTDNPNKGDLNEFFNHLAKDSVATYNRSFKSRIRIL